ncbi:MAG TPA: DUF488 domain-containing protein [Candidatus Saccharimonadales bacterium]|nr:DUF488 domain-containing protein [Candidatus Saccharimonadales bacterium]
MKVVVKRAYEPAAPSDGYRVLVDRLWPRGVKKEDLKLDEWLKDVAPSDELRQWFGHDPAKFEEFAKKYRLELGKTDLTRGLLKRVGDMDRLTLVYSAKDEQHNQAMVLRDYLGNLTK